MDDFVFVFFVLFCFFLLILINNVIFIIIKIINIGSAIIIIIIIVLMCRLVHRTNCNNVHVCVALHVIMVITYYYCVIINCIFSSLPVDIIYCNMICNNNNNYYYYCIKCLILLYTPAVFVSSFNIIIIIIILIIIKICLVVADPSHRSYQRQGRQYLQASFRPWPWLWQVRYQLKVMFRQLPLSVS